MSAMEQQRKDIDERIKQFKQDTKILKTFFIENHKHLRNQIRELKKITTELETMHRRATISSLSGGVIGAAGGITTIVGLILSPFTFGASLIVTGVGLGVAAAGGITGAVSNITKMVQKKSFQDKIRGILADCESRLRPVIESLNRITTTLHDFQAVLGAGRAVSTITQLIKVSSIVTLAGQATKAVGIIGRTIPVLSSLTLILDVVTIALDAKEIHQIRMRDQGETETESDMLKFITELKETTTQLEQTLEELERITNAIDQGS